MRIGVAQTKPLKGNIQENVIGHSNLIDLALGLGAEAIFFPELSITGYEPELAGELAMDKDDSCLDVFQQISNIAPLTIGVGIPLKTDGGICISMVIFQPHQSRQIYSKKYIHRDEEEYFIPGNDFPDFFFNNTKIALAICYEISIPQHAENACRIGAEIYLASVAKSVEATPNAINNLADIAKKYSMTSLMSNCVGLSGGYHCGGNSTIWNNKGLVLGQLDNQNEGVLIFDTERQEINEKYLL